MGWITRRNMRRAIYGHGRHTWVVWKSRLQLRKPIGSGNTFPLEVKRKVRPDKFYPNTCFQRKKLVLQDWPAECSAIIILYKTGHRLGRLQPDRRTHPRWAIAELWILLALGQRRQP